MILWGSKIGDNTGKELYSGSKEQCVAWCRTEVPAEYNDLDICEDNGVILFKIFKDGKPAEDFEKLFSK